MKKILVIYEVNSPSAELVKDGFEGWKTYCAPSAELRYRNDQTVKSKDVNWCDVVVFVRGLSPLECGLFKKAKAAGKFTVLNIDDDMLNPPDGYIMLDARKKALREIVEHCDTLMTYSSYLSKKYAQINANHRSVFTANDVNEEDIHPHKDGNDTVKIVYAAGKRHSAMFEEYIVPVLADVAKEAKHSFEITCFGNDPDCSSVESVVPVKKIGAMPMKEYMEFLPKSNFDIGLAPVHNVEFSYSKDINKFLNYAPCGIVGIYTNCEPYTSVVVDKVNGLLADNTYEGWKNALVYAIDHADALKTMRDNAYEILREHYTPEHVARKLDEDMPELGTYSAPQDKRVCLTALKLRNKVFVMNEKIFFFFKHLQEEGIGKTLKRTTRFLKSRKKYGEL